MPRDYLAGGDAEFDRWANNLCRYVDLKCSGQNPQWSHVPQKDRAALKENFDAWRSAYAPTLKPHTKAETAEKKRVKAAAVKHFRGFVNRFLRYEDCVTDFERNEMEIPVAKKNHSRIPAPVSQAACSVGFPGLHMVELKNIRPVSGPPPDPRSLCLTRIFYGLTGAPTSRHPVRLSVPPKSGRELPESATTGKRKRLFDFDGESGNTVYFCLRYESPTGGEGPFGPIFSAVVT
jgi:hypothetical protein